MNFYVTQSGQFLKVGIESNSGVELFESTKHYRSLDDGMTDIVGIVEMCRNKEIIIKDKTDGKEE